MFSGVFNGGITVIYICQKKNCYLHFIRWCVWVCDVSMCVRVCD